MSNALSKLDTQQVHAFRSGDEQALLAIYRQEYEPLIMLAREELGAELTQYSPKIAQQAMLEAWKDRSRFENDEGLNAYLEQCIRELSASQRRRHSALHRRSDSHGSARPATMPTAEEAVAQLSAQLHAPPPDHEHLLKEASQQKKHHAAEHVQKVGKGQSILGPALLIGVLLVAAIFGLRMMDSGGEDVTIDKALKASDARSVATNRGQRGPVTLSDDSKARLGADTRLRMPRDFGTTLRTLDLTGAAYFEVAPGKELPFRVRAGQAIISATGTAFAVKAYEGDSVVLVSVAEGTVDVSIRKEKEKKTLNAGEALRIVGKTMSPVDAATRDVAMAWTRDSLILNDMPVKEVLPELERWFDLHATLGDPSLGDRRVTLRLPLKSSGDAIKTMADSAHLKIGFDKDEKVVLSDAPVVAKPAGKPAKKR